MEIKLLAAAILMLSISNIVLHFQLGWLRDEMRFLSMYLYGRTTKTPTKPTFKPKKQEETEEERKYNAILDNIDNYDGTGKNQKEVR